MAGLVHTQQTQGNSLAQNSGNDGYADVDGIIAGIMAKSAVLRRSLLSDIQVGHNLDPANQRGRCRGRQGADLLQYAVDAYPYADTRLGGFDMYIAGAAFGSLVQQSINDIQSTALGGNFLGVRNRSETRNGVIG